VQPDAVAVSSVVEDFSVGLLPGYKSTSKQPLGFHRTEKNRSVGVFSQQLPFCLMLGSFHIFFIWLWYSLLANCDHQFKLPTKITDFNYRNNHRYDSATVHLIPQFHPKSILFL